MVRRHKQLKAEAASGAKSSAFASEAGAATSAWRDAQSSPYLSQTSHSNLQAVLNGMFELKEALTTQNKAVIQDKLA
jgi:hypothetical protein